MTRMMCAAFQRRVAWRGHRSLIGAVVLGLALLSGTLLAGPAIAAPSWGIEMTNLNPYGQAGGVDPNTGSAESFARESAPNEYRITVTNTSASSTAGGVAVGTTVRCSGGPTTASLAYSWLRNGVVVTTASSTYTTSVADAGDEIQCEVQATTTNGTTAALSTPVLVAPVPATAAPSAGTPTLTGSPNVGGTLTCAAGSWSGSPTFAYQWLRKGSPIAGATSSSYTTGSEDVDSAIQCQVTGSNAGGSVVADTSARLVVPPLPEDTTQPTLGGATSVGETLTCTEGTWSNTPVSYSFTWLRNDTVIAGAVFSKYTLASADEGKAIQCEVTASNATGSTVAASTSKVITPAPSPPPPGPPTAKISVLVGKVTAGVFGLVTEPQAVGDTLRCLEGSWSNAPSSYEYSWLRNGVPVAGSSSGPTTANRNEYTLTSADAGQAVQCKVSATNASGTTVAISTTSGPNGASYDSVVVAPEVPVAMATVPTVASVSVSDDLPAGIVLAAPEEGKPAVSGTGWTCSGEDPSEVACTRSDELAAGASYSPIVLYVEVEPSAPLGMPPSGGVTNAATVYGGGAQRGAVVGDPTTIAPSVPFGIHSFTTSVVEALSEPFSQAGGHPFAATTTFLLNYTPTASGVVATAGGHARNVEIELPPGFIGNPRSAPTCNITVADEVSGEECPSDTAVGYATTTTGATIERGGLVRPFVAESWAPSGRLVVYNTEAPHGKTAMFTFHNATYVVIIEGKVRSNGDYGLSVATTSVTATPLVPLGAQVTFCVNGVVTEGVYPSQTVRCAPTASLPVPMLTNPTECAGSAPVTTLRVDSYQNPGVYATMTSYAGAPSAASVAAGEPTSKATPVGSPGVPGGSFVTGCNLLTQAWTSTTQPSINVEPEQTGADEPSGYGVELSVPQKGMTKSEFLATSDLDNTTVTLPEGVTLNPSAADGLQACSERQIGYLGSNFPSPNPIRFNEEEPHCPNASKVGTLEIVTPLLEKPLTGSVYLAAQNANPFGSTFAIYLAVDDPATGIVIKLAGKVTANPETGQLTATFKNNPQLPFSDFKLSFFGGSRASLANPQTCGTYTTTTALTPWSAKDPEDPTAEETATPSSQFKIDSGAGGAACAGSPAGLPFAPSFSAGTESTTAGAFSPFSVTIQRKDGEQDLSGLAVKTPLGLLGEIAGIPRCSEIAANAGTCSPESQIGTVTAGAGAGEDPFYLRGRVYLTGPYRGAPFGLSVVVPAVAGPFNLGAVVVRAAIEIDPHTAQLTVVSDPLPQIVEGVPLRLRTIDVNIDRKHLILNPTSCTQQAVSASISSAQGAAYAATSPFDVGGCGSLPFHPTFTVSTSRKTSRKKGASLTVKIGYTEGQANVRRVHVQLPKQLPSRLATLHHACPEAQFAANPAGCPAGAIVGSARAATPVLGAPLTGPAYFVSHAGAKFPELVLVLQGEGVTIDLAGETFISGDITTSTFASVPDAPVSSFELTLPQGKNSVLSAPGGKLCQQKLVMPTVITGQNGAQISQKTKIHVKGCAAKKRAKKVKAHRHKQKHKHRRKAKSSKRPHKAGSSRRRPRSRG